MVSFCRARGECALPILGAELQKPTVNPFGLLEGVILRAGIRDNYRVSRKKGDCLVLKVSDLTVQPKLFGF